MTSKSCNSGFMLVLTVGLKSVSDSAANYLRNVFSRVICWYCYQVQTQKKVPFLNLLWVQWLRMTDSASGPCFQDPGIKEWLCCEHMVLRGIQAHHSWLLDWHGQSHDYETVWLKRSSQQFFFPFYKRFLDREFQNHMARRVRGSVRTLFRVSPIF